MLVNGGVSEFYTIKLRNQMPEKAYVKVQIATSEPEKLMIDPPSVTLDNKNTQ
jgi:hypothetical protein